MNATIGDALLSGITILEGTVKTLAPEVWRIFVRQQITEGIIGIIVSAILLTVMIISLVKLNKTGMYNTKHDYGCSGEVNGIWIAWLVISIFSGILCVVIFFVNLGQLLNPEYYAIRALKNTVT